MLQYIKFKEGFLQSILKHFYIAAIQDMLLCFATSIQDREFQLPFLEVSPNSIVVQHSASNIYFQWLNDEKLVDKLFDIIGSPSEGDRHFNAAQFCLEYISASRCIRQTERQSRSKKIFCLLKLRQRAKFLCDSLQLVRCW